MSRFFTVHCVVYVLAVWLYLTLRLKQRSVGRHVVTERQMLTTWPADEDEGKDDVVAVTDCSCSSCRVFLLLLFSGKISHSLCKYTLLYADSLFVSCRPCLSLSLSLVITSVDFTKRTVLQSQTLFVDI